MLRATKAVGVELISFSHSCFYKQGVLREERRNKVHRKWPLLLQLGLGLERGWRRRRSLCVNQGVQYRVASHVTELGPELAEQCQSGWTESFIPSHHQ